MIKPLTNALHHWWPRTLSSFWADMEGNAHCIDFKGSLVKSKPKSFGAIRSDNNIRLAEVPTVWDQSFEATFDKADSTFAGLIKWLQSLHSPIAASAAPFSRRLTPIPLCHTKHATLAECLASLIVRSPNLRSRVRAIPESFWGNSRLGDAAMVDRLVGMNVRNGQKVLSQAMARGGKFAVLLSGDREFIFGDGFLHNISSVNDAPFNPRCVIPLTPEIAILYISPMSCRSYPKAFVMNLTADEVEFVNWTVQVYSSRFLFFREIHPVIEEAFEKGEHRQLPDHKNAWLDSLEKTMADAFFGDHSSKPSSAKE